MTFFPSVIIIYSDFLLIHVEYHSKSVSLHLSPYFPTDLQQKVKPLCAAIHIFRILNKTEQLRVATNFQDKF